MLKERNKADFPVFMQYKQIVRSEFHSNSYCISLYQHATWYIFWITQTIVSDNDTVQSPENKIANLKKYVFIGKLSLLSFWGA